MDTSRRKTNSKAKAARTAKPGKAAEAVSHDGGEPIYTGFSLEVNGTFFQRSVNLDKGFLQRHIDLWPEAVETDYMSYNLVYRLLSEPVPRPQP